MKRKNLFLLLTFFTGIFFLNACQKELSCGTCPVNVGGTANQPPVARAGTDQSITLPTNFVTINAGTSSDPDGSIVIYAWREITGPARSIISDSTQASSPVTNLVQGMYQFEIKVTDNGGLSARDTVQVSVEVSSDSCVANRPVINARLIPIGRLSQARQDLYIASVANKILFAGGFSSTPNDVTSRVDIYDIVMNTWTIAELSQVRHGMTVATIGNKILLAGGGYNDRVRGWLKFKRVDIYDAATNTWSTAELSEGRGYLASATRGDQVFFAGGYWWDNRPVFSDRVDIYNNTTNTWSTATLSEARQGLTATTAGDKVYFAGGSNENVNASSHTIDIYDGSTNAWTTSALMNEKEFAGSIAFGDKIYWAGGYAFGHQNIPQNQVEIRNINTQVSTVACLSQAKASFGTVIKENEIIFFMGPYTVHPTFDIYNTATNNWSIGTLNQGLNYPAIISVKDNIYVAGGESHPGGGLSDQVSLLVW